MFFLGAQELFAWISLAVGVGIVIWEAQYSFHPGQTSFKAYPGQGPSTTPGKFSGYFGEKAGEQTLKVTSQAQAMTLCIREPTCQGITQDVATGEFFPLNISTQELVKSSKWNSWMRT